MERLTAFEFIAASESPQLVRLTRRSDGAVVRQFAFSHWIGVDLSQDPLVFEGRADLVIEGEGLGRPYWNGDGDQPSWLQAFDSRAEAQRIEIVRAAVVREINRARIALAPSC